jgi:hypothetical protein
MNTTIQRLSSSYSIPGTPRTWAVTASTISYARIDDLLRSPEPAWIRNRYGKPVVEDRNACVKPLLLARDGNTATPRFRAHFAISTQTHGIDGTQGCTRADTRRIEATIVNNNEYYYHLNRNGSTEGYHSRR